MRSYFAIELTPGPYGGGYFEGKASFRLDNLRLVFNKVSVKIDTGCAFPREIFACDVNIDCGKR